MFLEELHELWKGNVESVHAIGGSRDLGLLLVQSACLLEFAHSHAKIGGILDFREDLLVIVVHILFLLEEEVGCSILCQRGKKKMYEKKFSDQS